MNIRRSRSRRANIRWTSTSSTRRAEPLAAAGEVAARHSAHVVLIALYVAAIRRHDHRWFAILFTGQYPRSLFDFVVGVTAGGARHAYVLLNARRVPAVQPHVSG